MGCCGNKAGCKRATEQYSEQIIAQETPDDVTKFIAALQEIAGAGLRAGCVLRGLNIKTAVLVQLAKQISDLAVEHAYLKTVLNLFSPADLHVQPSALDIHFGPNDAYTLSLPVTRRNSRREIAKQLRAAAEKLEAELVGAQVTHPDQKVFPFVKSVAQ